MPKRIKLKETDIKYLAGLVDSDGSVGLHRHSFVRTDGKRKVYAILQLTQGPHGRDYLQFLTDALGIRLYHSKRNGKEEFSLILKGRKLKTLADRLVKFMVVKGAVLKWLIDDVNGAIVDDVEYSRLMEELRRRRKAGGPVKPRNFVGMSWIAGFLDGDGAYRLKVCKGCTECRVRVCVKAEEKVIALRYLQKTLGGNLYGPNSSGYYFWTLGLGKGNRSRAIRFLMQMRKRTRIKFNKIDSMIRWHEHQQRLSRETPKGDATV